MISHRSWCTVSITYLETSVTWRYVSKYLLWSGGYIFCYVATISIGREREVCQRVGPRRTVPDS